MPHTLRIAFITNICPHYRVRTFELLAHHYDTIFYFFSAGDEWYWQHQHGTRSGSFRYEYLPGVTLLGTRLTPRLIVRLMRVRCDVFVKCINGRFALPITYLIARLRGKPFILWTGVWMKLNTRFHRLVYPATSYIYRNADAVVTYGNHVRQFLLNEGVNEERIFVAHHAVDNAQYCALVSQSNLDRLRKQLCIDRTCKVVLYLGRLERNKGLPFLVEAFRRIQHRNSVLILAGDGSDRTMLDDQVRRAGLTERVRFVDYVKPEATVPYYALASVCVLPSITTPASKELWGLVVNEAMNQGCPVVVSDAVGAAAGGLVRDQENGFIVPEQDSAHLAEALDKVLGDPVLRDRLADNARKAIAAWDNKRMVDGFRKAVEFVTRNKRVSEIS